MKKFVFPLDNVLKYKERVADQEKEILSRLRNSQQRLDQELQALAEKFSQAGADFARKSAAGISIPEMTVSRSYLLELETLIDEKRAALQKAEQAVAAQIRALVAISQEQKSMEMLKSKHLVRYQAQVMKNEEIFIEEFVVNAQQREEGNGL